MRVLEAAGAEHAGEQPDAERAGEDEPEQGEDVDAEHLRTLVGEDPDQARPDQAAGDDERDRQPVEGDVHPLHADALLVSAMPMPVPY